MLMYNLGAKDGANVHQRREESRFVVGGASTPQWDSPYWLPGANQKQEIVFLIFILDFGAALYNLSDWKCYFRISQGS